MRKVADIVIRAGVAALLLAGAAAAVPQAHAQQSAFEARLAGPKPKGDERLTVEANELVYDNDNNTVTARGNAELHYGPRVLQADVVRYDRATSRVFAEGNVRLTDETGAVVTGDRMELTDDFKSGFIDSLRVQQTIVQKAQNLRVRIAAPRAERIDAEQISADYATYTACEPCKEHPEKPPLWQIKATKIIQNSQTHTISYEDASLEVGGIPVAYLPYFETPDPSEKRRTGFLTPRFVTSTALGTGVGTPFFVNLAPSYDLTLTPTFLSRQGVLGQAEFRQRLDNGSYNVRLSGIFQASPSAFLPGPLGASDRDFRGSVESKGRFFINDHWRTGWDVVGVSDKWFLDNYRIRNQSITTDFFREAVSTAYLIGQGDRSYFEARGYYFKSLSSFDWQKEQPYVAPVIDYDKRVNGPGFLGGEVRLEANLTSLTRQTTDFQGVPRTQAYVLSPSYNGIGYPLYETCLTFTRSTCIVRGLAGNETRFTAQASWRRSFVDDYGQVFTPFSYLRADTFLVSPSLSGYQNALVNNITSVDDGVTPRVMPAIGLDYRYPFVGDFGALGVHTIEPIAQIIVRPSETRIGHLPNEDAQSLVFDDTSLFEWDKFSGYDRVEGGTRANLGGQYSVVTPSGWYANLLFGESFQVAGVNSFRRGDLAGVGLDSGLEKQASDFVGRFQVSPNQNITFITRFRLAQSDLSANRFETGVTARFSPFLPLETSLFYSYYEAQPDLGFSHRREGITATATYHVTPNWFVTGSALVDLTHYLDVRDTFIDASAAYVAGLTTVAPVYERPDKFYLTGMSLGAGYQDECTTVSLNYINSPIATAIGTRDRNQTVLLRVELKSLGEADLKQNVGTITTTDGISAVR